MPEVSNSCLKSARSEQSLQYFLQAEEEAENLPFVFIQFSKFLNNNKILLEFSGIFTMF
jgi:hypothetical protein